MNDSAAMGTLLSYLRILENGDSPILQYIGKWAYKIYEERQTIEILFMYGHLLVSALFPIWIGAHSSLRQPPSAARSLKDEEKEDNDEDDDEIFVNTPVEGMGPWDAIVYPVTAGIVLTSLFLFIKWMGDAKLLNKIMTVYFSASGIFGIANLVANTLNVIMTFVFPNRWSDGKETFYIDAESSRQLTAGPDGMRTSINDAVVSKKTNPFPGFLSAIRFPARVNKALWSIRASFKKHWVLRCVLYGVVNGKQTIHLNTMIGFVSGCGAILFYNLVEKSWWLTNLMAFGFAYGAIQVITPTTFPTGSLVLSGLFAYDIFMVFYTPMMKTVAMALDVPVKLVFPGPKHGSMLGLGDVVLPAMMLAMALRFDLYLHYLHKQVKLVDPPSESESESGSSLQTGISSESDDGSEISIKEEKVEDKSDQDSGPKVKKERFVDTHGQWGDRFWTRNASKENLSIGNGAQFPKVYFKAGLIGYIIGMIVTLYVCSAYNAAQPALLYLVPGVLIALWGTALVRKELGLMWDYTEDGKWGWDDQSSAKPRRKRSKEEKKAKKERDVEHARHIFLLSLSEPKHVGEKKKLT